MFKTLSWACWWSSSIWVSDSLFFLRSDHFCVAMIAPLLGEVTFPDAFGDRNHSFVEAFVSGLVSTQQQNGLPFGVEGVEDSQRVSFGLHAKFTQSVATALDRTALGESKIHPDDFEDIDAAGDLFKIMLLEVSVPSCKFVRRDDFDHEFLFMRSRAYAMESITEKKPLAIPVIYDEKRKV